MASFIFGNVGATNTHNKWRHPSRNIAKGDIVILKESGMVPTKWPLRRVVDTHPGQDEFVRVEFVRVVTVQTSKGTYRSKIAVLLPNTN